MRIIIYGAGAVGGVIGAQLYEAGHDVLLIARGAHFETIRDQGLTYKTPNKEVRLNIPVAAHPRDIDFREGDVVILCTKSQHTVGALNDLRAATGDLIPVICCQNSVVNERLALRLFQNVYAMLVYLPAESLQPGLVVTHAVNKIGVLDAGCYPSGVDDLISDVMAKLESASFSAQPTEYVMRFKYAKLLTNLSNALNAACPSSDAAKKIRKLLRREGEAALTAAGIDFASREEEATRRGDLMQFGEVDGVPRGGGSSWQSVMRGTGDIETDYLNGEITYLGRLHGVATPANRILQRVANELARQKGAAQSLDAADLLAEIETS
jgi:2-dehydropantoate 2-reductase